MTGIDGVIEAGVLNTAFACGEDFQLALRAVHQLLVGTLCPLERDLRILFTVCDEERYTDTVKDAVKMDVFGDAHKGFNIFAPPHPAHVFPVVRHRETALFFAATLLHVAPVVICAPHHAAGKSRFERHRARAVVATKRDAFHTDPPRIDVRLLFQPVHDARGPVFTVKARLQIMQTQRFAGAWLIDHQR